jgi:hypothetical protein
LFRLLLRLGRAPGIGCGLLLPLVSCVRFASELDVLDSERSRLDAAPAGGDWSCAPGGRGLPSLASSPAAQEPAAEGSSLRLALAAVDFVTGAAVEELRVRACFRADVECASPISEQLAPGAGGSIEISADPGFNGYLELQAAGMLPSLLFFSAPWSSQLLAQLERTPVRLLPASSLQALGNTAHIQLDPAGGVLGVYAYDCAGAAAPGVRLELDTGALPYAFVDELPVADQDVTSEQGLAGFVNVPPGVVLVSSFVQGQPEAVSVESLLVRSGWLSSMSLLPGYSR